MSITPLGCRNPSVLMRGSPPKQYASLVNGNNDDLNCINTESDLVKPRTPSESLRGGASKKMRQWSKSGARPAFQYLQTGPKSE